MRVWILGLYAAVLVRLVLPVDTVSPVGVGSWMSTAETPQLARRPAA